MAVEKIEIKKTDGTKYSLTALNGLESVESHTQSTTTPNELMYGVVANSGSVRANDDKGEVYNQLLDGTIPVSNTEVAFFENGKQKSVHISTDSDYTEDRDYSLELQGKLSLWDKIEFKGRAYSGGASLYDILKDALITTLGITESAVKNMMTENIVTVDSDAMSIETYLREIRLTYDYLEQDTLRNTVDKICEVAQLNAYEDEDGNIKFTSSRPRIPQRAYPPIIHYIYKIPANIQLEQPQKDVILRNKYDGVEIEEINVKNEKQFNIAIHEEKIYDFSNMEIQKSPTAIDTTITNLFSCAWCKNLYKTIIIEFDKKSNFNLNEITQALTGGSADNPNISYVVKYKKYTGVSKALTGEDLPYPESVNIDDIEVDWSTDFIQETGNIPLYYTYKRNGFGSATAENEDLSTNLTATYENTNPYRITLKLNCSNVGVGLGYYQEVGTVQTIKAYYDGTATKYEPLELDIFFAGDLLKISFDDKTSVGNATSSSKTIASIRGNTLLQNSTLYAYTTKMSDVIKDNILNDYSDGISTVIVKCTCEDIYDTNAVRSRVWANGETYKIGDYVRVDKDNGGNSLYKYANGDDMIFRVTGITHRFDGQPIQILELQEIK